MEPVKGLVADRNQGAPMTKASKPPPDDDKAPSNVTLPPIDAEPEEIAQSLFQRPPQKKRKDEQSGAEEDRWRKKHA